MELSKTRGLKDKVILVSFQDSIENAIDFINEYGRGDIIYAIDTESKLAIYSVVFLSNWYLESLPLWMVWTLFDLQQSIDEIFY